MKYLILIMAVFQISCNQKQGGGKNAQPDTVISKATQPENRTSAKTGFNDMASLIKAAKDTTYYFGIGFVSKDSTVALSFRVSNDGQVEATFTYGIYCYLDFPGVIFDNKILLKWDPVVDSKNDRSIESAIESTGKQIQSRPFMSFELSTDTTLKGTILIPEFIKKFNKHCKFQAIPVSGEFILDYNRESYLFS